MSEPAQSIRADKWLWYARFFKSRSLAAKLIADGGLRVNGERTTKRSRTVAPGDALTFVQGRVVRVIKVLDCGTRRGPAVEAQTLYEDLSPPEPPKPRAGPRPDRRTRQAIDRLKGRDDGNAMD